MKNRVKTALSLAASIIFVILAGCSNADSVMRIPGHYLLNGTLSEFTDANNFAYYINDDEAYVARGSNTSLTPEIPATVTLNGNTYDVTGIYHGGFAKSNITSITLPLSITTIDYQAFAGSSLTSAVIPCNVEEIGSGAYMNCHSLTAAQFKNDESAGSSNFGVCGGGGSSSSGEVTGTAHLTEIPDYCFFNDENLTTLSLPRSLTTVNTCAFQACRSLEKVAFLSGFTTLKKFAFESCTSLTDIYFPNTFTTASNNTSNCDPHAFYRVNSSCTIHLSSVTSAAYNVWSGATAWRSCNDDGTALTLAARTTSDIGLGSDYLYRVENGEATIFSYAPSSFPADGIVVMPNEIDGYLVGKAETTTYSAYLSNITQVYLSKNLKKIEDNFFKSMTALTTVSTTGNGCYVPADNVIDLSGMTRLNSVGNYLFCTNYAAANAATYMVNNFTGQVILPKCLKTIGNGAFCNLKMAGTISISATTPSESLLESIGSYAFYNYGLNLGETWGDEDVYSFFTLTLPATCTSIGTNAFSYCLGLKKIEFLGASGKSLVIGNNAFQYCRSLCEIVFPKEDTSVSIGAYAFDRCSAGGTDNGKNRGFLDIPGIQEVYFPANVTTIGARAFGCDERACFYFEATSKPAGVATDFNYISTERIADGNGSATGDIINSGRDEGAMIGYFEYAPVYYGVGYHDGSSSSKRRYLQTNDFGFVETDVSSGEFICTRYRFNPKNMPASEHAIVTVPEYIKYKASPINVYDGETGATTDLKVVSLGDSCFSASYSRKKRYLSEVNVPHSIKRIGDNCFARAIFFNKLSSYKNGVTTAYNFPESLKYIGRSPFILTRLHKALNIPGDVLAFDMIDPAAIAVGTNPVNFTSIDKNTPVTFDASVYEPRRYGCMFANDWYLDEVTFTTNDNFYVNTTTRAIYRKRQIASDGTLSDNVQLLMIMARLTTYNVHTETVEKNLNSTQNVTLGDTGYEFDANLASIRYGAFKIATWIQGLKLDVDKDVFAKRWSSDVALPQSLFNAIWDFPTRCPIGAAPNDKDYFVNLQSMTFVSTRDFDLPADVGRCCKNLVSMTFPKNVTSIPLRAFDQATGITSFITPNDSDVLTIGGEEGGATVLDFRNNDVLASIGQSAFYGNASLTKLFTSPALNSLGNMVWQENKALTYLDLSASTSLTMISQACFKQDPISTIIWPSGSSLITINSSAFDGNKIVHLMIPDSVSTIGGNAFSNGTATRIVRLPASLNSHVNNAFSGCTNLNQVYFGNPVTGATSRKNLGFNFPSNVKYALLADTVGVGNTPFNSCTDFKELFYGRKHQSVLQEGNAITFTRCKGGSGDALLYYYAESQADLIDEDSHYFRFKAGSTTTVQIVSSTDFNTVLGERDFTQLIS